MSKPSFPIDFSALVALTTASSWSVDPLPGNKTHEEASFELIQGALDAGVIEYGRAMDKAGNGAVFCGKPSSMEFRARCWNRWESSTPRWVPW